jgi:multiple sugar transport system ATP-binding protein
VLGGTIAQVASPAELYDNPNSLAVARFIGTPRINTIPACVGPDGLLRVGGHNLAQLDVASTGRTLTAAIRPEHVELGRAHGHLAGSVVEVEHLGYERLVHVETALARIIVRMTVDQGPAPRNGDEVGLHIDGSRLLLFDNDGGRVRAMLRSRSARSYA